MKKILIIILLFITLTASNCEKENEACHKVIYIKNNSNSIISIALVDKAELKCRLIKVTDIYIESTYEDHRKYCWENKLAEYNYKFIIIHPDDFDHNKKYDCDSLYQNVALKYYDLTLEDLQKLNFTITYP